MVSIDILLSYWLLHYSYNGVPLCVVQLHV